MVLEIIEKYVEKTVGCWIWVGAKSDNGYSHTRDVAKGKQTSAHRLIYEFLVGPIPDGMQLDHLCRNRICVNPAHLEPVTCKTNILRGFSPSALNARKTHCKRGHALSGANLVIKKNSNKGKGQRVCRICRNNDALAYQRRKRGSS